MNKFEFPFQILSKIVYLNIHVTIILANSVYLFIHHALPSAKKSNSLYSTIQCPHKVWLRLDVGEVAF